MRLDARARYALLAIAAALLVAGLYGPVRRSLDERARAEKSKVMAEQVARERAEAAERFKANRDAILADLRAHVEKREYREALRLAAPFGAVPDEELRELFREAARAESLRQRGEAYAQLVTRDCNEAFARDWAARIFASVKGTDSPPQPPGLVERIAGAEARAIVMARMREPSRVEHVHAGPPNASVVPPPDTRDWLTRMRDDNRARLLADYTGFVLSPDADRVICVWRAQGERRDGARLHDYTMDLWLAPSPDGKSLVGDPATYRERPR
jgi:hypothetical protein